MIEKEKIAFLSEKVKDLNRITSEIEEQFPEKSFKLDGILIGNIVEVMAAHIYGITLYKQSETLLSSIPISAAGSISCNNSSDFA